MHEKYLAAFRNTAQSIDAYLRRSFREITHPGPGEELQGILDELLPEPGGIYVDIGANDPIQISNTWNFYSRGWQGLLVEPDPDCFYRLLRHRPRDFIWPGAASDHYGTALLRADASGVSSIEPDWPCPEHSRELVVELMPTRDILEIFSGVRNECRLCSIDVEGHEKAVLQGIDFDKFRPEVLVVESLRYDPVRSHEQLWPQWEPILIDVGYKPLAETSDGVNRVYTWK